MVVAFRRHSATPHQPARPAGRTGNTGRTSLRRRASRLGDASHAGRTVPRKPPVNATIPRPPRW